MHLRLGIIGARSIRAAADAGRSFGALAIERTSQWAHSFSRGAGDLLKRDVSGTRRIRAGHSRICNRAFSVADDRRDHGQVIAAASFDARFHDAWRETIGPNLGILSTHGEQEKGPK